MTENEVPERIYCTPTEGGFYLTTIKPEPPFTEGVEYIQTEAFIEKACVFIRERLIFGDNTWYTDGEVTLKDKVIEDFKNCMKEE